MADSGVRSFLGNLYRSLRGYFIAGLLVLIPIYVTIGLTRWTYEKISGPVNTWIQQHWKLPELLRERLGYEGPIPGLGLVITLAFILGIGLFARNYVGKRIIGFFERLVFRIPLVSKIYNGAKQVSEAFFQRNRNLFQAVVLVEYPRRGIYTIGFLTQTDSGEISDKLGRDMACVFISTTPNPTSGVLIVVPRSDLVVLDMSIEEGLKMVISGGVVTPEQARALPRAEPR
jgi:uncharacterized membrane protein